MIVLYRNPDTASCPAHIEPYIRSPLLTEHKPYIVHSVVVYQGIVFYLIIDDDNSPNWEPAWLFDMSDSKIPMDWTCGVYDDWPNLVLGPEFITVSQDAYRQLVEREPERLQLLAVRIAQNLDDTTTTSSV